MQCIILNAEISNNLKTNSGLLVALKFEILDFRWCMHFKSPRAAVEALVKNPRQCKSLSENASNLTGTFDNRKESSETLDNLINC